MTSELKIGIVGSGLIGRSWAMLFTSAGYQVVLYDSDAQQVTSAQEEILKQLQHLEKTGLLRGSDSAAVQSRRISGTTSLESCVKGAFYVQESTPENLAIKKQVFDCMDAVANSNTILASSTSCIPPSKFSEGLVNAANCIVAHPTNPPYYVPLVEVVPAPWTSQATVETTRKLMLELKQEPVTFLKEAPGFGANRLQYAILNEAYYMVNEGILSAADVDKLMSYGLGPRYAWMGPLETAHLNADGMANYIERYGATISNISKTLGGVADWSLPAANEIVRQMNETIPLDNLQERRSWRNDRLAQTALLRTRLESKK